MKQLAIALVTVLCVAAAAAAQQASSGESARQLALAREALTAGRADEAATCADRALAIAPRNREAVGVRIQAAFAQGRTQDAFRVYDSLVSRPADHDVRLLALIGIGLLDQIVRADSPNPELGAEALYRLARNGSAPARQELERRMTSVGYEEATLPIRMALARLGDAKAAEWFAARVQSAGSDRVEAIRVLADLKLVRQANALLDLLTSGEPGVRASAAAAAGALGYREALPQLRVLLKDDQPGVRMYAAVAVKRLGDASADEFVATLLQSQIPQMRLMAAEAYQASNSTQWVPLVRELLTEPNAMIRLRAAELLACCDRAVARSALLGTLDSQNPLERLEAVRILEDKGLADPPLIRRLLGDADPWVRMHAAGAALAAARAPKPGPPRS
jgi:tetratricopeptide (TPR) repeat protein